MATIDELKKKDGSAVNAGAIKRPTSFGDAAATSLDARVNRIPTGGATAPAFDGKSSTEIGRQVNNSLNSLGGMGVVASVPLKTAAAVQSGYGALQSSVKAAPMLANGVPGANFIAGANGVRQVGGANLPAVINAGAPVAKSVNVALQEGAKANQLAAGTQSFGNASAALGVMDGQQVPPAQAQPVSISSNPNQIPAGRPTLPPAQPAPAAMNPGQIPAAGYPAAPAVPAAGAIQTAAPAAPLDAQAQADRAALSKVGGAVADGYQRLSAGIADVATLVPRGVAGAYDSAVVRPMRAAGMNAAYLSPMLAPAGADPASQTPFYDQIRQRDAAKAGAPPVNQSDAESQRLARTGTTGTAPQAVAPQAAVPQAAPQVQAAAVAQPRDEFSNAATLERNPGGAVRKIVDANGKTTGYSGGNVTGDIALTGANGGALPGRARGGLSSMDTSAGYASDLKQLADIQATKDAQQISMQGQADYTAMRAGQMSQKTYQAIQARNQANTTTQRGQDIQAGATREASRIAQERLKLDVGKDGREATAAGFQTRAAGRIEQLQTAYESAKPEEKSAIAEQLRMLTGKDKPAQWKAIALQGSTDAMGNKTESVLAGVNEQTGEVRRLGEDQPRRSATPAPQQAVAMLKANPKMAAEFDAKYGPGQSALILGQK